MHSERSTPLIVGSGFSTVYYYCRNNSHKIRIIKSTTIVPVTARIYFSPSPLTASSIGHRQRFQPIQP